MSSHDGERFRYFLLEKMQGSSRSLAFRRCRRRNHIKIPSIEGAKLTSKWCRESKKSNSIWSDRFFFNPPGGKIIFFESLSTIGIDDWNRNLMVLVLPNKVFYGSNDVVQRDSYLEWRDKEGNSEHIDDDEHEKEAYVVNT